MASDKEKILAAIRANKPDERPLPQIPAFDSPEPEATFRAMVPAVGASLVDASSIEDWDALLSTAFPDADHIFSTLPQLVKGNLNPDDFNSPGSLQQIGLAIIAGELGVAENGAIWVSERQLPFRVLPFIATHLLIVLPKDKIVANMHEAYQSISIDEDGFGVFIAGPSKTADIEQSLVKGAQGAKSVMVVLS